MALRSGEQGYELVFRHNIRTWFSEFDYYLNCFFLLFLFLPFFPFFPNFSSLATYTEVCVCLSGSSERGTMAHEVRRLLKKTAAPRPTLRSGSIGHERSAH